MATDGSIIERLRDHVHQKGWGYAGPYRCGIAAGELGLLDVEPWWPTENSCRIFRDGIALGQERAEKAPMTDPISEERLSRVKQAMALDLSRGMTHGIPPKGLVDLLFKIPDVDEAMRAWAKGKGESAPLLDHISEMQHQMRRYLSHEIDADAFISEIIERLDGPKWREIKGRVG